MCGHSISKCNTIKTLIKQAKIKKAEQSKERKYTKHEGTQKDEKTMHVQTTCFQNMSVTD